jgi:hypothetical protein
VWLWVRAGGVRPASKHMHRRENIRSWNRRGRRDRISLGRESGPGVLLLGIEDRVRSYSSRVSEDLAFGILGGVGIEGGVACDIHGKVFAVAGSTTGVIFCLSRRARWRSKAVGLVTRGAVGSDRRADKEGGKEESSLWLNIRRCPRRGRVSRRWRCARHFRPKQRLEKRLAGSREALYAAVRRATRAVIQRSVGPIGGSGMGGSPSRRWAVAAARREVSATEVYVMCAGVACIRLWRAAARSL